jgi:hypothetical protein
VKRYFVWTRFTAAAGAIPDERDRDWNIFYLGDHGRGYANREEAARLARNFEQQFQPGMMETFVAFTELPETEYITVEASRAALAALGVEVKEG